ncbi:hypothetical protein [Burkholderia gladioli]|uniref:hypothetical protein n=1 Tax=Burkholderia gladioli TaxID=28095 RepID=UPI00163DF0B4|nr:hypothetical protein [Burkholderia gladioli]
MTLSPDEVLKHLGIYVPRDGIEIDPTDSYRTITLLQLLGRQLRIDAIPDADLQTMLVGMHGVLGQQPGVPATPEDLARLRVSLNLTLNRVFGMKTASTAPVTPEAAAAELASLRFDFAGSYERNAGMILLALRSRASEYRLSDAQASLAMERLEQLLVGLRPLHTAQIYTDFAGQPLLAGFADALYEAYRPNTD